MDKDIPDGTGSFVSISGLENGQNILDKDYGNYATYVGGLALFNNLAITGVKRTDGLMFDGDKEGQQAVNVGFVVESDNEVIDAKVLEFFQIRCYKLQRFFSVLFRQSFYPLNGSQSIIVQ